ncbi:MAG: hypothetical protein AAGI45_02085 [Cyanobacteria bacterium P01_H01_bin.26]
MLLVTDSPISAKVEKMRDRVRWQHAVIQKRRIGQTRLCIDDGHSNEHKFSFLVLGDSGTGRYRGDSPQRRAASSCIPMTTTADLFCKLGMSSTWSALETSALTILSTLTANTW